MLDDAIILTDGQLESGGAKTAHGVIIAGKRFRIRAVVDVNAFGKDAGTLCDGKEREIPVYQTIAETLQKCQPRPKYCIVGVAPGGGKLSPTLIRDLDCAIRAGIGVVSGLHDLVAEHALLRATLIDHPVEVIDIRRPKPFADLHHWSGAIFDVRAPRVAVLGMDCGIGKRSTTSLLLELCTDNGIRAEMIYTGQTGWMLGLKYGFIFDATLNDFVSGELEHAVVTCDRETRPDLILIEGQSALRNPSGPCGSELICSALARGVILQVAPARTFYKHREGLELRIPSIAEEIALIKMYGAEVLAVTLNTRGLEKTWEKHRDTLQRETGLPVVAPREDGVAGLLPVLRRFCGVRS